MITIKRYANRKLYDTQAGRYVTLDEIGDMIRRGDDLRVVDHASGADLTTLTLLQVVLEQEKSARAWLPQHALARLIQAGETRFTDIRDAILSSLESPEIVTREIARRVDQLVILGHITPEEAERLKPLLLDKELFSPASTEMTSSSVSSAEIHALIAEVERLNTAVDELTQQTGSQPG